MAMWYYSERNQQKGPVSWGALSSLARDGVIRSSDLVWQEGTPDWVRASKVPGLFEGGAGRGGTDIAADEPASRRRSPREDYDDDRPRRSPRKAKSSSKGLMIGLIAGGVGLVIIAVVVIIIIVANSGGDKKAGGAGAGAGAGGGKGPGVPGPGIGPGGGIGGGALVPTRVGLTVNGSLDLGDPRDLGFPDSFCKTYKVELVAGRNYTFAYNSDRYDCWLRLEDPTGMIVAEDDDGGPGLNSLIGYHARTGGTYRLICTSLDGGGTGPFALVLREN